MYEVFTVFFGEYPINRACFRQFLEYQILKSPFHLPVKSKNDALLQQFL